MQVFITGVAGFLGKNLAKHHLQRGDTVFGIDNFISNDHHSLETLKKYTNFHFIEENLNQCSKFETVFKNIHIVYHFAAILGVLRVIKEPELVLNENIFSTYSLLQNIQRYAKHARVFLASSSEVYGHQSVQKLSENLECNIPLQFKTRVNYVVSKLVMECYGLTFYENFDLKITILRIFNIIGQGQRGRYGMVVPRMILAAKTGQPLEVFGDGSQSRCFCDVRDFIGYVSDLADCPLSIGKIVNVGHDKPIRILELAKLIKKIAHSESKITLIPFEEVYHQSQEFIHYRQPDLTLLHSLVPYRSQYRLEQTLEDLIKYED